AGVDSEHRGLKLSEVTAPHSETVIMGTPVWFEVLAHTGRSANWFGVSGAGNMLFLDGSVRFITVDADSRRVSAMFNPIAPAREAAPAYPAGDEAIRK